MLTELMTLDPDLRRGRSGATVCPGGRRSGAAPTSLGSLDETNDVGPRPTQGQVLEGRFLGVAPVSLDLIGQTGDVSPDSH